ncbi:nucleoside deaminase, partial [Francisella tularensis]|nr:nucleoside deaminase [Francisella tularensis]
MHKTYKQALLDYHAGEVQKDAVLVRDDPIIVQHLYQTIG